MKEAEILMGENINICVCGKDEEEYILNFFEDNELEIPEEEPVETSNIKSWKACIDDKLVGAATLAMRENKLILDGIAVEKTYRKKCIGEMLLKKVINEAKSLNKDKIFLVARAPDFFLKYGFEIIEREASPQFFECFNCSQYGKTCNPKVMRIEL